MLRRFSYRGSVRQYFNFQVKAGACSKYHKISGLKSMLSRSTKAEERLQTSDFRFDPRFPPFLDCSKMIAGVFFN